MMIDLLGTVTSGQSSDNHLHRSQCLFLPIAREGQHHTTERKQTYFSKGGGCGVSQINISTANTFGEHREAIGPNELTYP